MLERDKAELVLFEQHLAAFDSVWTAGDQGILDAALTVVVADMRREVDQAQDKAKQAQAEKRQSSRELRRDRRERREDEEDNADEDELRRDRIQQRDDRRDRRDDINDLQAAGYRDKRQGGILSEITASPLSVGEEAAFTHKQGLIQEFLELLKADYEATGQELAEDQRERREDRRSARRKRKNGEGER